MATHHSIGKDGFEFRKPGTMTPECRFDLIADHDLLKRPGNRLGLSTSAQKLLCTPY